jgi:hypothetical protein
VDSNLKVTSIFKKEKKLEHLTSLLAKMKQTLLPIVQSLQNSNNINLGNYNVWASQYRHDVMSLSRLDCHNFSHLTCVGQIKTKLNCNLTKLKKSMKARLYDELKFFGDTDSEINSRSNGHQARLRNSGIQIIQKEKDYSKLREMTLQYIKIDDFIGRY